MFSPLSWRGDEAFFPNRDDAAAEENADDEFLHELRSFRFDAAATTINRWSG